ncbi:MAG: NAD-dependent deacylase [Desulfurococcales archaeon]|nr:NAD-dependent deacylase [Desulfurococcales archaeon]
MGEDAVKMVAQWIRESSYTVVLTGAGVSAESGIPTFRGRDGLWNKYRPEELATPEAFNSNPKRVWEWYKWRMELIAKAQPNLAHIVLAKMQQKDTIGPIITQNVDGLHQRAGAVDVVELHGNIWRVKCISCSYASKLDSPPEEIPPRCPECGSLLRPGVVWFGEPLPEQAIRRALQEASHAKLILVVGTSLQVYPAAYLPVLTKNYGGHVVIINPTPTPLDDEADLVIRREAGEFFEKLGKELGLI